MKVILLVSFVIVIVSAGEPCSTADHLVVDICREEITVEDDSKPILIKSDKRQNCTCEFSLTDQNQSVTINFQRFNNQISSYPSNSDCGLMLTFSVGQDIFGGANCFGVTSVSKPIVKKDIMTIRSIIINGTLQDNEGYCIETKKVTHDKAGMFNLTCGIGSKTTIQTATMSEAPSKVLTTSSSPPTTTASSTSTTTTITETEKFTFGNFTRLDGHGSTQPANQLKIMSDNDDTTVLAAGGSVGGIVIIIVVTVVVCIYRRYYQRLISKQGPALDNESDDYGMRNNVLYVSSHSTDTDEPHDTNRISVDIDGNYSTVDLVILPSIEESTGDYSSIDLVKPTLIATNMSRSSNKKPIIAQKPKQKVAIQDDVYAVPDKKKVKHVTAPGDDMCEYAVVSKQNKSNVDKYKDQTSTSNVYAVVAKKKRIYDGEVTNQKKDSLTSEIDRETCRSSKS